MFDNVVPFPDSHVPTSHRVVEAGTIEQFCVADSNGAWDSRINVSGMVILQFPRVIMICCDNARVTIIHQRGTNLDGYFFEAMSALDLVA